MKQRQGSNKRESSKLTIERETVRRLSAETVRTVRGRIAVVPTDPIPTTSMNCDTITTA